MAVGQGDGSEGGVLRDFIITIMAPAFIALLISVMLSLGTRIGALENKVYYGHLSSKIDWHGGVADVRSPELESDYAEINKNYFSNKLPHNVKIYWSNDLDMLRLEGWAHPEKNEIQIAASLRDSYGVRIVLVHEIVHFKHLGHGTSFQEEMKRLAKEDAFWGAW